MRRGFIGGEAEFAVVPALYMVEFDVCNDLEHGMMNAEAQQRAHHARDWLLGDEHGPSREGEVDTDFRNEVAASTPSREGPSSPARAMASVEDGPAADEAPLVLPESLLPEMVSADQIRREQQRDEFASFAGMAHVSGAHGGHGVGRRMGTRFQSLTCSPGIKMVST